MKRALLLTAAVLIGTSPCLWAKPGGKPAHAAPAHHGKAGGTVHAKGQPKHHQQIRHEIDHLRHERDRLKKEIQARYHHLLHRLDVPEDQLEHERNQLRRQEREALRLVTDPAARARIHGEYGRLIHDLNHQVKIREAQMGRIQQQEKAELQALEQGFNHKIRQLEQQLHPAP